MALRDEILNYRDADGLVSPVKVVDPAHDRNVSGNGLLYTSEFYITLVLRGEAHPFDPIRFTDILKSCTVEPGLYKRSPSHPDQQAPDDYIGVAAAAYFLGLKHIAHDILDYGRAHNWVYDNTGEGSKSAWFWRMPHVIAHFQFAAGEFPPLWRRMWWAAAIIKAAYASREDQDARTLSWLMIKTMDRRCTLCSWAADIWWMRLEDDYPGGVGQVLGDYFGNIHHPLAVYFID